MSEWVRTWEHGSDYREDLAGVAWMDAPLPYPWHKCTPQTRGWIRLSYVERCACGAIRSNPHGPWSEKNATRKSRKRGRREAKAPKETVTCASCGQPYEAIAGSAIAAERLCTRCWGDALVRAHGDRHQP